MKATRFIFALLISTLSSLALLAQDVTVPGPGGCNTAPMAGVFEIPCGVTNVTVEIYGGGGGAGGGGGGSNGGFYDTRGGGGGGGGAYVSFTADVTPGALFNYSIAAGGCGGGNGADFDDGDNGSGGGTTTISGADALGNPISLTANGGGAGGGGDGTEGAPGNGGAGGTANGGDVNTTGTPGNNGNGGNGGPGGAGAGPAGGPGGATEGAAGTAFGGGGAGGGNSNGGNGAPGGVLITFNGGINLPPAPTITSGPPTCTLDGTSTVDNYDPAEVYTIDPPGPTVGAGGLITGMTAGTNYVLVYGPITCPSEPSVPFSNAPATGNLDVPIVTTTPATCTADGFSVIDNYNPALTYTFDPLGPTAGAGGAITGMTVGTSYTVIATEGATCVSPLSPPFSNQAQLSGPAVTITGPLSHCPGGNTTITASGGVSYLWDGGQPTATVTLTAGNYTVDVTDAQGCTTTEPVVVTLSDVPSASLTVIEDCDGLPTQFTDISTITTGTITDWDWDFGDGNGSTDQSPVHTYTSSGSYTVVLTVSAGTCSDDTTLTVNVFPNPTADFTTANVCIGEEASFTDNSSVIGSTIDQWAWDFDGEGNAGDQNPVFTFANPGTYSVSLGVITADFCADTYTADITVYPAPVPAFTAAAVCQDFETDFVDESTVAAGQISIHVWDFGDMLGTSTDTDPSYTYLASGTFPAQLIVTTTDGCTDSITQDVTVNPLPEVTALSTDILCAGQTNGTAKATAFGGTGPYSYSWNDFSQSTQDSIGGLFAGSYTITITDALDCTVDTTVIVDEPLPIVLDMVTGNDTCSLKNGAVQAQVIGGTAPFTYIWSAISDSASIYSEPLTPSGWNTGLSPGDYSVTVIDSGGCSTTGEATVGLIPKPRADFLYRSQPEEFRDPSVQFDNESVGALTYEWHLGDERTSFQENPVHLYDTSGVFLVMLIAYNDPVYGCADTTFKYVEVDPFFTFYVPNAFTPDGDGDNDTWGPKGLNFEEESYNVQIFDRWGNRVWQTDNPSRMWDGMDQESEKELKQGMYFYQFLVKEFNTFEPKKIYGTVYLYRHN